MPSQHRLALLFAAALIVGLLVAVVVGTRGGDDDPGASAAAGECPPAEQPEPKQVSLRRPERVLERGEPASATVETSCGRFVIELDTTRSPKTANSFAFLAEEGVYDGTWFHRIVPGFVIQGGDPKGDGTGGPGPDYMVVEPPPDDTSYLRGTVAMAKTGAEPPGASGSQFFVVTAPADAGLPPDYAVLGEVVEGMDVVERIGELGDPQTEEPLEPVVIESVTIERQ